MSTSHHSSSCSFNIPDFFQKGKISPASDFQKLRGTQNLSSPRIKINRTEITRDLCNLESFIFTTPHHDKESTERETIPSCFQKTQTSEPCRESYTSKLTPEIKKSFVSKPDSFFSEPPSKESKVFSDTSFFIQKFEEEDGSDTPTFCAEATKLTPEPVPQPALSCEILPNLAEVNKKTEKAHPSWMWNFIAFGSLGTACSTIILGQHLLGMPLNASVINWGVATLISGSVMFLAATSLFITKKRPKTC
ncbi:MAG: hypothetical protein Q4C96_06640 [Planctomycetia bacterium]|nr:hypothetical protein [Planctomycetia bacterium]